jgi:hypothetical protein
MAAAALVTGNLATAPAIPAEAGPALPGSVPRIIAGAQDLGAADPATHLHLVASLGPRDPAGLDRLAHDMYTPGSASFHQYLTPAQFGDRFGASLPAIDLVSAQLQALGFAVEPALPNRLQVDFDGTAGQAEHAFGVSLRSFRLPDGRRFVANVDAVHLPGTLKGRVRALLGLDTSAKLQPQYIRQAVGRQAHGFPLTRTAAATGGVTSCPQAKPESGGGYTAEDLAAAYDFGPLYSQGIDGTGMNLAVLEYDDYATESVQKFEDCYGIAHGTSDAGPVQRRLVQGGVGGPPGSGETEAILDIDVLLEMAPRVGHLYVYENPNNDTGDIDSWNAFVTDRLAPVMSSSWGSCEELVTRGLVDALNPISEEAVVQGQTLALSAGDAGTVDCRGTTPTTETLINVLAEASLPWVLAVGGTNLSYTAQGGRSNESTWNDAFGAGGGGISAFNYMPDWQAAATGVAALSDATTCGAPAGSKCRVIPDISANADIFGGPGNPDPSGKPGSPGYAIFCDDSACATLGQIPPLPVVGVADGWQVNGGTSASAPFTSAMILLTDQLAESRGLRPLGFVNPAIYRVAGDSAKYAADFHDITTDSNDMSYDVLDACGPTGSPGTPAAPTPGVTSCTGGRYKAGPGFDLATGWGSFDAAKLAADLVADAAMTATPSDVTLYGYTGGPATGADVVLSSGAAAAGYTAGSDAPWLAATPSSGTQPGILRVTATPALLGGASGTGTVTIHSGSQTATVRVHYSVGPRATLSLSPGTLLFHEDPEPSRTNPNPGVSCSNTWDDEISDPSNNGGKVASSLQTLTIGNAGAPGSVLHWHAHLFNPGGEGYLSADLNTPAASGAPNGIAVPFSGDLAQGSSYGLKLASLGSIAADGTALPPGVWPGSVIVQDLADPSVQVAVPASLTLGDGVGTPTITATPQALTATLAPGGTTQLSFNLTDAAQRCGYSFSIGSDAPWADLGDPAFNGTVPSGASPSPGSGPSLPAGGGGSGPSETTENVMLDATGLSAGVHVAHLQVSSQNALPQPYFVNVILTVSGVAPPTPSLRPSSQPSARAVPLPNTVPSMPAAAILGAVALLLLGIGGLLAGPPRRRRMP